MTLLISYLWEGNAKRRSSLNSRKTNLSDTITISKSKDASGLTKCNTLLNAANSPIEFRRMADIVCVCKDERLVDIKADSDNVLGVGNCKTVNFVDRKVFPQELFVICKLNYQRHIKCVLQ